MKMISFYHQIYLITITRIGSKTHNSFRKGLQYVYYMKSHLVRINCGLCDIYCDIINRKMQPSCSRWTEWIWDLWFWLMQIIWMIKGTVPNSSLSHAMYITEADYWSPVTKKNESCDTFDFGDIFLAKRWHEWHA